MIPNSKKCESKYEVQQWNHLTVKKLLALLRGITSKNNGESHLCLNQLYSFIAKHKLESHKKECKKKDFFQILKKLPDTARH